MMYNGRTEMIGKAFVGLVALLFVLGMLMALALLGYNPWKFAAEARRMDIETQYLEALNDLKLAEDAYKSEMRLDQLELERDAERAYLEEQIRLQPELARAQVEQAAQLQEDGANWLDDPINVVNLALGLAVAALLGVFVGILLTSLMKVTDEGKPLKTRQAVEPDPTPDDEEPVILSVHGEERKINVVEDLWASKHFRELAIETARRREREARAKVQQAYSPQTSRKLHQSKEPKKGDLPWDSLPMAW